MFDEGGSGVVEGRHSIVPGIVFLGGGGFGVAQTRTAAAFGVIDDTDAPLLLGVRDAGQAGQESLPRIDHDELHAQVPFERHAQELGHALAQQAMLSVR